MSKSILIVEDEETLRESIKRIFTKEGYAVDGAESAEKGLALLETNVYDVIISDIILPGMDGIEMLTKVREQIPDQIFIVVTAYASLDTSVKALRAGAYDYIMKPIIHEEIKQIVRNALRQKSLQSENVLLKREIGKDYDFSSIIGESAGAQGHPRRGEEGHGHQEQRAAPRRDGHGQGAFCPGHPPQQLPPRHALRADQLLRHPREPARDRALRPRARRFYRRGCDQERASSKRPKAVPCSSMRSAT